MASRASRTSASTSKTAPAAATAPRSRRCSPSTGTTSPRSRSRMSELAPGARLAPAHTAFRVLVVDDDPDMATFLARLLESEGMAADTVFSGDAAMVSVMAEPPDLILLDVLMPGIDGFEVCERVKADPTTAMIPIVLVTALEDHDSRVRGIGVDADDFLSKPV